MNEKIKEYKIDNIVMGILSAVVGVILVIFPGTTLRMIGYLVSAALFLMGIVSIIIYMRRKTEDNFMKNDFLKGLVAITLGVCTILKVEVVISLLPLILGIIIIISGCSKLQETIDMARVKSPSWFILLITAIINIALGVLVVCNPFNTMKLLVTIIGIGMIFGGVTDVFITLHIAKKMGGKDKDIIDVNYEEKQ